MARQSRAKLRALARLAGGLMIVLMLAASACGGRTMLQEQGAERSAFAAAGTGTANSGTGSVVTGGVGSSGGMIGIGSSTNWIAASGMRATGGSHPWSGNSGAGGANSGGMAIGGSHPWSGKRRLRCSG